MTIQSIEESQDSTTTTAQNGIRNKSGKNPKSDVSNSDTSRDQGNSLANQSVSGYVSNKRTSPNAFNSDQKVRPPVLDQRVRLIVPERYLRDKNGGPKAGSSANGVLYLNKGIIFPYTPTIEVSHSASYSEANALHSNYTQYFYKNSKVSEIIVKGKFSCQNEFEASVLLAVLHLGRALTKMNFGGGQFVGSPPPICMLMGYGQYMFDKVPVAVQSFSMSVPDDVDYITVNQDESTGYGSTSVPVLTDITFELLPMYSKKEMLGATVDGWLQPNSQRLQGFL